MATKNVDVKVLQVTKTTAEWAAEGVASVVIAKGLLCVETTTDNQTKIKVGDGVHTFAQLPYATSEVMTGAVAPDPDTPGDEGTPGKSGAVPAPLATDADKFLRGDGTWVDIDDVVGNTTYELSGAVGTGADSDKYIVTLAGSDGSVDDDTKIPSYVGATASNYELLASQPEDWTTNYTDYYISDGDGGYTHVTGSSAPAFAQNTYYKYNAAAAGVVGLVPAATAGTTNAYLRSDGTWDDTVLTSTDTLICTCTL